MGDLSRNFSRDEWQCKCGNCDPPTVDAELVKVLQEDISDHFKRPVVITPNGGHRCKDWNKRCGGVSTSQHILGKAADFNVKGVSPITVYTYLIKKHPERYGVGVYDSFVHLDIKSGGPRRWDKRHV